ncbi:hypothetical protein KKF05_03665 [Patescibacteria group bacterium]|nr:hypothetical protein [Patescibacteria group bacterium]MBU1028743.1 hypothetical protein [Patescibacteria group bacterium]MBU1915748.1 hypothetical protein [Patescibacteria group bacterium]
MTGHEMYYICSSRREAEQRLLAIAQRLKGRHMLILRNEAKQLVGLVYNPRINDAADRNPVGDVNIRLHESRVPEKFQLTIRSSNRGHHERVRAALTN